MPLAILSIIQWIIANPQVLLQGEQFVVGLVQDAIRIWQSFQSGNITHDELLAQWTALGVDIQAVRDDWQRRHPPAGAAAKRIK